MLAPAHRHLEPLPDGPSLPRMRGAQCSCLRRSRLWGSVEFQEARGGRSNFAPGQALFHEGERATRVFTLTRGALKLYKLLADGRRQVTGFMHPGDFLGISVDDEHAFSAEALEELQLCCFPRDRFDDFVDRHSPMERDLYRKAAHELAAARQQMVLLGRKTATERLASFLLDLADRTGSPVRLPMS